MIARRHIAVGLLVTLAIAAPLLGDESKDLFNSVFGAEMKKVESTADPKDDLALAQELLEKTKDIKEAGLVAVMCDAAWTLTSKREAGLATAAAAMQMMIERVPARGDEALDRLADVRLRQYNGAKADAKQPAASALVDVLLALARRKAAAGDEAGETSVLRRAMPVARAAKLEQAETIRLKLDAAQHKVSAKQRIARLEAQLNAGPNTKTAEELTQAYLIDLDNPVDALAFAQVSGSELLKRIASLAGKPTASLDEQECFDLGSWYQKAGNTAAVVMKPAMLTRAQPPLRRYLTLHTAKDLLRAQAELTLKDVDEKLKALGMDAPDSPRPAPPVAKVKLPDNLLKLIDPNEDPVYGAWRVSNGSVTSPSQGAPHFPAVLTVPVSPIGDYKLEVRLIRRQGDNSANIILPVGSTYAMIVVDGFMEQGGFSGIETINGVQADKNATRIAGRRLVNDREHIVEVAVAAKEKEASIIVTLDGKPLSKWTGSPASLGVNEHWWRTPDKRLITLGSWWCSVEFTSVRLQMLTGEAKPIYRMPMMVEATGERPLARPPAPAVIDFSSYEFVQSQRVGNAKDVSFLAKSDTGRPMIGMRFQIAAQNGNTLKALAMIMPDAGGASAGLAESCGVMDEKLGFTQVIAPPGYAIGAISLRGGDRVHALKLTFMRLAGDRLDPTRQFETRWFGGFGDGKEVTLGGDGKLIVGLHGRASDCIENLGVVQLRKKSLDGK